MILPSNRPLYGVSPTKLVRRFLLVVSGAISCFTLATDALGQIASVFPMPATVTVHVGQGTHRRIPDKLFGSFLEPIGKSINQGLSAEILVNPSLEAGLWNHVNLENPFREQPELIQSSNDTGIPLPWQALNTAAGNRFELHVGRAANSWQSLEIIVQSDELTGIMQKVYLPVQRELTYNVSLYARHISGPTAITVSFRDPTSGRVLATSTIDAPATQWTKYATTLHLVQGQVQRLEPVTLGSPLTETNALMLISSRSCPKTHSARSIPT